MIHSFFWKENPALLYGLTLLIGTSSVLFWPSFWNWVWPCLWLFYLLFLRKWQPLLFLFAALFYGYFLSADIDFATRGYFSISSLRPHQSPFAKGLIYKGDLFIDSQKVPCAVHVPLSKNHPQATCDYILKGKLKQRGPYDYLFQAKEWIAVPKTFSLAEMRYQAKERLRQFLETKLKKPRVASFLGSLLTGDVEDRSLRYEFAKLGLQHILAISGFHFAILIAFCSFFLKLFLSFRGRFIVLLILINAYFIFLGSFPAVQRSYLMVLFFSIGKLLKRHAPPLNLLGAALFFEVLFNPFISSNLGFQLSFASCFAILLLRPIFLKFAFALFPKREPETLTVWAQHGYLAICFLREALAVTLAVNATLFPLIFLYFHSFPLLSLLYNLFFPLLVSVALFLLLLSLFLYLLFPPLSLFPLTDWFTGQLLELTAYPPLFLDFSIQMHSFPSWLIPFYLSALFCISLLTNTSRFGYDPTVFHGDRSSVG